MWNAYGNRCGKEQLMDKIDTEIRFDGMAEERLRREDPHYHVWSFTDDDDVTAPRETGIDHQKLHEQL